MEYEADSSPYDLNLAVGAESIDAADALDAAAVLDITLFDVTNDGDNDPDVGAYEFQAVGGPSVDELFAAMQPHGMIPIMPRLVAIPYQ